ncbi:MAG: methyltransferase domain-containing protein [Bauldia sp.]|nr:MAG: methyltransferase domain-containing protein [Bauldia sp.]
MSTADESSAAGDVAAGLMDRIYRRQRHIYDATRKFFLLGRDHLIERLEPPPGGLVLEIGCGTGRNLVQAARRYPTVGFFGLDVSQEMLTTATANIVGAGLAGRIALARGDATAFDPAALFGRRRFDRVFFSYSLSMMPEWRRALSGALACVERDGRLLLVDFGGQERLPAAFRSLLLAWLARFHVVPRSDLARTVAGLAAERNRIHRAGPLFRGYALYAEVGRILVERI